MTKYDKICSCGIIYYQQPGETLCMFCQQDPKRRAGRVDTFDWRADLERKAAADQERRRQAVRDCRQRKAAA